MNEKKIKFIIFLISICLIISISINLVLYKNNVNLTQKNIELEENIPTINEYLNSITVKNFESQVLSGKDFFVYIGRPDCGDCNLFEPMFKTVIDEYTLNDKIIYMNIKNLRENNMDQWQEFKNKYGFTQTPAIIHFNNGNNISIIEWNTEKGLSKNSLIDWLKNNNLINN